MRKKPVLKYVVSALLVLVAGFAGIVALQPSDFRVTRSATIAAPPETVFSQVNDLHRWEAWSPWAKLDPAAKNSYEGPAAGIGAAFCGRSDQAIVLELSFTEDICATSTDS